MTLKIERDLGVDQSQDKDISQKIFREIKKQIFISAEIEMQDYGSLPRSERKSVRVFDKRE